jgi:hypothetical protein
MRCSLRLEQRSGFEKKLGEIKSKGKVSQNDDGHFRGVFFCKTETKSETKLQKATKKDLTVSAKSLIFLERETGFEPATSTLARSHSTTELFPLNELFFITNEAF